MRGMILDEAKTIINGERQDSYGNPEDSFASIAAYLTTYLRGIGALVPGFELRAHNTGDMMVLVKMGRCHGQVPKKDNYTDMCGYAALTADILFPGGAE